MGQRIAVTATITSIVVFSTLLVANQVIYASENQKLTTAYVSSYEVEEALTSHLLAAEGIFNATRSVQTLIANGPPSCESWDEYSSHLSQQSSENITRGGVTYLLNLSVSYYPAQADFSHDNLSALSPFQGFQNGSLNLIVRVAMSASAGPGNPSFAKTEVHSVHLPIPLEESMSLCLSALHDLRQLAASPSCSVFALNDLMAEYRELAYSHGLTLIFVKVAAPQNSCIGANYKLIVSEQSVPGVGGTFDWMMMGVMLSPVPASR